MHDTTPKMATESGFIGLFNEDAVPESKAARLREGLDFTESERWAEPCDKTDVCY